MEPGDEQDEYVILQSMPTGASHNPIGAQPAIGKDVGNWFLDRAKYIPLRLTFAEVIILIR